MKCSKLFVSIGLAFIFVFSSLVYAGVPHMINYQGKITKPTGALVDTVVQMTFTIYDDSTSGNVLWADTLGSVSVEKGIFSVLLGSVNPIPDSVFDGNIRYLGIKVGTDAEMTPRKEIVSVAYAYRAETVQSGGFDCSDCDDRFVNTLGPDSVGASSPGVGALWAQNFGSSLLEIRGVEGIGENTSFGEAIGGYFVATYPGEGYHYGVKAFAQGTSGYTYGVYGRGDNTSTGYVYGGRFVTSSSGTGQHYGVSGFAYADSTNALGVSGWAYGPDSESALTRGGEFYAFADGPGLQEGVYGQAVGRTSSSTYGVTGSGINYSTGTTYGGYFTVSDTGTGTHYGVYASEEAGGSGAAVYAAGDYGGSGAKYAVVRTTQGSRVLSVIESPEVWFEDFGEGQLINGKAHIELDPLFLETVTIDASNPMKVFIQLNDPDCKGTAVIRGTTDFRVVELDGGTSNASFSYRLVAKRKGYENQRLKQTDIGMDDPHLYPELLDKIESTRRAKEALIEEQMQKMKKEEQEWSQERQ